MRFFSKSGAFTSYEMYSITHFILLAACAILIAAALFLSRHFDKKAVLKTILICTALLWIFEATKIIFNLCIGNAKNPNTYIPLYYCSIPLYCGILSSFAKGKAKRIGDVFLTVGGLSGGIIYLLFPSTTAGMYPAFHFITIQSFIHHSIMTYLGFLLIITNYINLKFSDISYYSSTVIVFSILAYIVNLFLDTNLMFVSKDFPGTFISLIYKICPPMFPVLITVIQAFPPFLIIYRIIKKIFYDK